MSSTPAEARIEQLEHIEEDVIAILKSCGNCLIDIAKDRPSQKAVDQSVQTVMNNIKSVDSKLSEQIKYLTQVSTGHPHEGSSYPSQKVLQSAWHRLEHVKTRISELDRLRQQAGLTPAQKMDNNGPVYLNENKFVWIETVKLKPRFNRGSKLPGSDGEKKTL